MHWLLICGSCLGPQAADALGQRLTGQLGPDWTVRQVDCMGGCTRPGAIAFRADGKASYLFGDVPPEGGEADILAFASVFAATEHGWITDARGFGKLREGSLARIPVGPGPSKVGN